MSRILAFCMTNRLSPLVLEALAQQTGPDFDLMISRDNPCDGLARGQYRNMMLNWQKMEKLVREFAYDKVWLAEADTIPPLDALSKLLEVDAPVVVGLYASRHAPFRSSVWSRPDVQIEWSTIQEHWGEAVEIGGSGTGCSLIDRSVFDRYTIDMEGFRNPNVDNRRQQIDQMFSHWCFENKVKQVARLDVICGHVCANGEIVWPDRESGYRIQNSN
jgi:hypothetical protein